MGASISGWTEAILLSLAFITVFGIVIAGFNLQYGQNYSLGLSDDSTEQLFIEYQDTAQSQIEGGEVEFDAQQGISLKQSYGLTKDIMNIIWAFLSGGFIEDMFALLNLGASGVAIAKVFRVLWFISVVFGLLYALFKVAF